MNRPENHGKIANNKIQILFVIGNGLDLFHGMQTTYGNFADFLRKKNGALYFEIPSNIDPVLSPNWSNFEEAIGLLDEGRLADVAYKSVERSHLDDEYDSGTTDGMDQTLTREYSYSKKIIQMLRYWIIETPMANKRKFFNLSFRNAKYITFNYTDTLERLYHVPQYRVWHVHGRASAKRERLLLGSDNAKSIEKIDSELQGVPETDVQYRAILEAKEQYYCDTNKDVLGNIEENQDQFQDLHDVSLLFVLGFSFGKVDLSYFSAISRNTKTIRKIVVSYFVDKTTKNWARTNLNNKRKITETLSQCGLGSATIDFIEIGQLPGKIAHYIQEYSKNNLEKTALGQKGN